MSFIDGEWGLMRRGSPLSPRVWDLACQSRPGNPSSASDHGFDAASATETLGHDLDRLALINAGFSGAKLPPPPKNKPYRNVCGSTGAVLETNPATACPLCIPLQHAASDKCVDAISQADGSACAAASRATCYSAADALVTAPDLALPPANSCDP